MKLSRLLDGPSRITTRLGDWNEFARLSPRSVERDLRIVNVRVRPVTTVRTFLYPWRRPIAIQAWKVVVTLQPNRHERYESRKLIQGDYERALTMMVLDVQKKAVMARLAQVEQQLAAM